MWRFQGSLTPKGLRRAVARLRSFADDQAGATIIIVGLALPVLIGAMGMAAELSYWRMHQRAMQSAADAAAIAAATNGGSTYQAEAQAVAAQYGFQNGIANITVAATNTSTATGCTQKCYSVTISDKVPLLLTPVLGFVGNATVTPAGTTTPVAATAMRAGSVATSGSVYSYCIVALAGSGTAGITSNGAPKANLAGCNIMSNTTATCNGHNLNANFGNAHGTNNGCGVVQQSNVPTVSDPYQSLATSIPADTCTSYPQEPGKKGTALPSANLWSGTYNLSGTTIACGDQQLTGDTTINSSAGAVLVIENGQLDTNGHTLTSSALTVIFSGSNSSTYQHTPTGGGGLDIAAPTSGTWSGVALYQAPALTTNVDISAAGNSPTWNMTGLVYLPHASVTFSGSAGASTTGAKCFELVVDNLTINGTGSIFANDTQCAAAGLNQIGGGSRGILVN